MKNIKLLIAILILPTFLIAQVKQHKKFGKEDLTKLVGKWTGTVTMAKKVNDASPLKMEAMYDITQSGDSVLVKATVNREGVKTLETYGIAIDEEITEWRFEDRLYDIKQIIRSPNKLIIKLLDPNEKAMIDDEYAEIKTIFTIGDNTLFITQEAKYFGTELFFVRKKIELNRQ
jgi:hypothetical protein